MLGVIFSLLNDRLSFLNAVDWNFLLEFCLINQYDAGFTELIDSYFDTVTFLGETHCLQTCFCTVISRPPEKNR